MKSHPSENYDERDPSLPVNMIIIHYTGMMDCEEALNRLTDTDPPKKMGKVSAHYVIDEDGTTYSLVDEEHRAWHAGVAFWEGITDINSASIGIELVNPGHSLGYSRFPLAQMQSLIALCKEICERHPIRQDYVLGHSDIAPGRKKDPGELFGWQMLQKSGIGLWPSPNARDRQLASVYLSSEAKLRSAFAMFGYNPEAEIEELIVAYNRHFSRSDDEELTSLAAGKLACLIRTKREILNQN